MNQAISSLKAHLRDRKRHLANHLKYRTGKDGRGPGGKYIALGTAESCRKVIADLEWALNILVPLSTSARKLGLKNVKG